MSYGPGSHEPEVANTVIGDVYGLLVQVGRIGGGPRGPVRAVAPGLVAFPKGSAAFAGRGADLDAVHVAVTPTKNGTPAVAAIAGMPGVGKTELAIQAARSVVAQGWYPGGALFLDLHGYHDALRMDPGAALHSLLLGLHVPIEDIPPPGEARMALYLRELNRLADEGDSVLVVLDNAFSPEQVEPLLPPTGAILTSRHSLTDLDHTKFVNLAVLSEQDAVLMLERTLRKKAADGVDTRIAEHEQDARELTRLCGYLPQALRIVGALLAEDRRRPLRAMIGVLADEHSRLDRLRYSERVVRAAFDLSYRWLTPDEATVFRLLLVAIGVDFSAEGVAAIVGADLHGTRDALWGLQRAHLIERTHSADERWRMHDLIRVYVAELARKHDHPADRKAALNRLLHYLVATAGKAGEVLGGSATDPDDRFSDQAEAARWLDAESAVLIEAVGVAAQSGRTELTVRLSLSLAEYLALRRRFEEWAAISDVAVSAANELGDEAGRAAALCHRGRALVGLMRVDEAAQDLQEAAAAFRGMGRWKDESAVLSHLGAALASARMTENAIAIFTRNAQIQQVNGDLHGEAASLAGLSEVLRERALLFDLPWFPEEQERFRAAIAYARRAVFLYRHVGDRRGEGLALWLLGDALARSGKAAAAIKFLDQAITVCQELADRPGEVRMTVDLAFAQGASGRADLETELLDRARAIAAETEDRRGEAFILRGHGDAAMRAERLHDAASWYEQAAVTFRAIGAVHDTGPTLNRLIRALMSAGRMKEAEPYLTAAMTLSSAMTIETSSASWR